MNPWLLQGITKVDPHESILQGITQVDPHESILQGILHSNWYPINPSVAGTKELDSREGTLQCEHLDRLHECFWSESSS